MSAPTGRLTGKSCLITGAARGIGKATAERFAREGARLVLSDVDEAAVRSLGETLRGGDVEAHVVVGDVSMPGDARTMVETAVDVYGGLDVLVANAGVIPLHDITEATVEDWDHVMSIDGRGAFLSCKYAIEAMLVDNRGGAIVLLSSISGLAGQSGQSTYGPAKFVASGLAMHLAVEWAHRGIRVNAVAPGTIMTDRVRRLPEEPGGAEYLADIERRHPLGRIGLPEEAASAICFLASDEASFITGTILPVDGGYLAQ
ncbi:SDR family NAD(P)-dependent oxidoreductase [Streptomyces longisporoflavus]|uniref:SDR family NAD(P)-dependent oxidoreductase n=1 Tax=Streptomyces longisporoflavus TaxID=28044 RepID=A0ABW7R3N5_9ACTN